MTAISFTGIPVEARAAGLAPEFGMPKFSRLHRDVRLNKDKTTEGTDR